MSHGSPAEWTQTVIATVGVLLAVRAVMTARQNSLETLRHGVNGRTAFWGVARTRQESILLMHHIMVFWIPGFCSLFMEPGSEEVLAPQALLRVAALMAGTIILTVYSFISQLDQEVLVDYQEATTQKQT